MNFHFDVFLTDTKQIKKPFHHLVVILEDIIEDMGEMKK